MTQLLLLAVLFLAVLYLGKNPDLFVKAGRAEARGGKPAFLWAAWEE